MLGLKEAHWSPASTVAAGLAFLVGAALWWLYFDTAGAATTSSLQDAVAGVALYLLALAGTQAALRAAASRDTLWPVAGAAAVLAAIPIGRLLPPTVALGLVAAVVIATLALGLQRREHGFMPVTNPV